MVFRSIIGSMRRRDVLKRLAAFAACVRAYAKTPQGAGLVVVRIAERHSEISQVRGGVELTRERIAIGAADFGSDVECAGFIRDTLTRAGAGETPVVLAGDGACMKGFAHVVYRA